VFNGQTYTVAGTYSVTLTAANGCDSVATLDLAVLPVGSSITDAVICSGDAYVFNGQTYTAAGLHADTLVGANGCDSVATLVLTVSSLPTPAIAQNGQSLTTGTYASYAWYLGGVPVPGATGQTFSPVQNGIYTVVVTDANGCSASSPGFNATFLGALGAAALQPRLFPNPARETVRIENLPADAVLQVFDPLGRPVHFPVSVAPDGAREGSVAHLAKGLYWLTVVSAEGRQTLPLTVSGE
jgi:hypothetical protein